MVLREVAPPPVLGGWASHDRGHLLRLAAAAKEPYRPGSGYKDLHLSNRLLAVLVQEHPSETALLELGRTHRGQPLLALRLGIAEPLAAPSILVDCSHHSNEVESLEVCFGIIDELLRPESRSLLERYRFLVVPLVNPDGSESHFYRTYNRGRKNERPPSRPGVQGGVDLNRNYPFAWGQASDGRNSPLEYSLYYRGPAAGSEPEVQAMVALARREQPVLALSFHSNAGAILYPYTALGLRDPEPNLGERFARILASAARLRPQGPLYPVRHRLYPVYGANQDFLAHDQGTIALLVEVPLFRPPYPATRAMVEAFLPGFRALMQGLAQVPTLRIELAPAARQRLQPGPVEVVGVSRMTFHQGERFPFDAEGIRWIVLPEVGKYRIDVRGGAILEHHWVELSPGPGRVLLP